MNGHSVAEAIAKYRTELDQTDIASWISQCETVDDANDKLYCLTGVLHFFESQETLKTFQHTVRLPIQDTTVHTHRQWGDFQTPPTLAKKVCHHLAKAGVSPDLVIEPTFGTGNFILAALATFPKVERIYGVEIQEHHVWRLKMALLAQALSTKKHLPDVVRIELYRDNIFTHHFSADLLAARNILIIGNPPWVTNSELGALEAHNLPQKQNVKTFNGLDAITGKSNFDICEFILLQMLDRFSQQPGVLAMLCKNAVIRNIIELLPQKHYRVADICALKIDAKHEFGAAVEASLLIMRLGATQMAQTCQVAPLEQAQQTSRTFGWVDGKFVADVAGYESYAHLDGKSSLIWRQGVKHDCAGVMELDVNNNTLTNGCGDVVTIEGGPVYWLLKSSDLGSFEARDPHKKVIITQTHPGDETFTLKARMPLLWEYLARHSPSFEKRKSRIYCGKPPFSIFGIGDYSFKPYKVAISGLYKEPRFSLVLPKEGRPVMLDDTCYLAGFDHYIDALFTNSLLNTPAVICFLRSIVFEDAKRPYTKQVLMRIDVTRAAAHTSFQTVCDLWDKLDYRPRQKVIELDWERYKAHTLGLVPLATIQLELPLD